MHCRMSKVMSVITKVFHIKVMCTWHLRDQLYHYYCYSILQFLYAIPYSICWIKRNLLLVKLLYCREFVLNLLYSKRYLLYKIHYMDRYKLSVNIFLIYKWDIFSGTTNTHGVLRIFPFKILLAVGNFWLMELCCVL